MIKKLIKQYKHAWVFLYAFIYIPWFLYLEKHVTTNFHVIHTALDDYIPFIELFIVPYLLWFVFIAVTIAYFFLKDKEEFYRLVLFLFTGMTVFLIISTVYPNGLNLRPDVLPRDNIFADMVLFLQKADTSTNVLPSIHVFNTIGACIAISRSRELTRRKWIHYGSNILGVLIILSTMFLKQHSVIDVLAAFIMAGVLYAFVYAKAPEKNPELNRQII